MFRASAQVSKGHADSANGRPTRRHKGVCVATLGQIREVSIVKLARLYLGNRFQQRAADTTSYLTLLKSSGGCQFQCTPEQ